MAAFAIGFLQLGAADAHALTIQNLTQWTAAEGGNDHFYGFVDAASISWDSANAQAVAEILGGSTGHLATITSAGENAFVADNVLPAANPSSFFEQVFIGGRQADFQFSPLTGYSWVAPGAAEDGLAIVSPAYTNWATTIGEPNGGFGSNEKYLTMLTNTLTRGMWADNAVAGTPTAPIRGFVIEFDNAEVVVVPEPDTALLLAGALAGLALIGRRRI